MASYYNCVGDHWRNMAYQKAIAALRKHNRKIATRDEARQIPQIGERLATKIEEIVITDRLRRLEAI
jgi:DNA polymerase IV